MLKENLIAYDVDRFFIFSQRGKDWLPWKFHTIWNRQSTHWFIFSYNILIFKKFTKIVTIVCKPNLKRKLLGYIQSTNKCFFCEIDWNMWTDALIFLIKIQQLLNLAAMAGTFSHHSTKPHWSSTYFCFDSNPHCIPETVINFHS